MVWVDPAPPSRVGLAFEDLHAMLEASWINGHKLEKQALDLAKRNRVLTKELKERKEMMRIWTMFSPIVTICLSVCTKCTLNSFIVNVVAHVF